MTTIFSEFLSLMDADDLTRCMKLVCKYRMKGIWVKFYTQKCTHKLQKGNCILLRKIAVLFLSFLAILETENKSNPVELFPIVTRKIICKVVNSWMHLIIFLLNNMVQKARDLFYIININFNYKLFDSMTWLI